VNSSMGWVECPMVLTVWLSNILSYRGAEVSKQP
jgi:hypothetical protein